VFRRPPQIQSQLAYRIFSKNLTAAFSCSRRRKIFG
jgi:hypothetical protein